MTGSGCIRQCPVWCSNSVPNEALVWQQKSRYGEWITDCCDRERESHTNGASRILDELSSLSSLCSGTSKERSVCPILKQGLGDCESEIGGLWYSVWLSGPLLAQGQVLGWVIGDSPMESLSHPQLLNSADCLIKNHPVAICTRRLKTQTTNNGHLFYEPRGVTNPRQCRETFPNIFTKLNSLKSLEREGTNMGGVECGMFTLDPSCLTGWEVQHRLAQLGASRRGFTNIFRETNSTIRACFQWAGIPV